MIHVKKICGVQKSFHSGIIDKFSQHKCGKKFGMRKTTLELTIKIHRLCKFVQKLYRFCDIFFVENLVPVLKSDIDLLVGVHISYSVEFLQCKRLKGVVKNTELTIRTRFDCTRFERF